MPQVTIAVGRNVSTEDGPVPMSDTDWDSFRDDVLWSAGIIGDPAPVTSSTAYFTVRGTSFSPRWRSEETYIVGADVDPSDLQFLRDTLSNLAAKYRQDAIALTIGDPEFVTAS